MSDVNSQTSVVPSVLWVSSDPRFIADTRGRVLSTMRWFFGQLAEPFIDALAKVRKTLWGSEEVGKKTLSLVQDVMTIRNNWGSAVNYEQFEEPKKVVNG